MQIVDAVRAHAEAAPDRSALTFRETDAGGGLRNWTYAELCDQVDRSALELCARLNPGDRVALIMPAVGASVATLLAAEQVGAPALLLPVALPDAEAAHYLRQSGARILFAPAAGRISPALECFPSSDEGWLTLAAQPSFAAARLPPDAFVGQLTSGSMGPSRLAVRTSPAASSEVIAVIERLRLDPDDTILCASSISHSYGLLGGVLASLRAGAHVCLAGDPGSAWAAAAQTRPTIIFGLAATYRALLEQSVADHATKRVRVAMSAGAPLPIDLFHAVQQRNGISIRQDYGTTETGTITIDIDDPVIPGRAGAPLSHLDVRLVAPVEGAGGPEEGSEIQVRSRATATGYLDGQNLTPCVDEDGWYHTADLGRWDASGRLWVGSRLRVSVEIGGRPVWPVAVERAIRSLPGVQDVVVVELRPASDRNGLKAVVVAPQRTPSEIRAWCLTHLTTREVPEIIELRAELPRSPAGKILQKYVL